MYLLIGLGNPGFEYDDTRHNIGKSTIVELAKQFNKNFIGSNIYSYFETQHENNKIICAYPTLLMNENGISVKQLSSDFPSYELIVIYDDLDIEFGELRIKKSGSSGGHNGLNSIIEKIGRQDFLRVKIGIGRPPAKKDPAEFVLEHFTKQELKEVPFIIEKAKEAVLDLITLGSEKAMNKWH